MRANRSQRETRSTAVVRLTRRECEVLRLLADGESTASCAAHLHLTESTVRTHVEHMLAKFGVHTRTGVVARAFRLGFLE